MRTLVSCFLCVSLLAGAANAQVAKVGIIGLDTSHVSAFTKYLNDPNARA